MVTEKFARWATQYSGCDGGNPAGHTWICGIEYGGGGDRPEDLNCDEDVSQPRSEKRPIEEFGKFVYNRNALKLLSALSRRDVKDYRDFYTSNRCFSASSQYFKLNLFPLGFKSTSADHWNDGFRRKTGLATKPAYVSWCRAHRFDALRRRAQEFKPRLVICTGVSHRKDFLDAFTGDSEHFEVDALAEKPIHYAVTNSGETLIAVTHFLGGPHGLNSDKRLTSVGQRLRAMVDERTG